MYAPPLHLVSSPLPLVFSCSEPLPYFDLGGSLEDISVRLVDYSEGNTYHLLLALADETSTATATDKPERYGLSQPSILRAPEVTLKYPWTSAIDIWTVGCLVS